MSLDFEKWIGRLLGAFQFIKRRREKALDEINRAVQLDPTELVKVYVKPNCQQVIPVDTYSGPRGAGNLEPA